MKQNLILKIAFGISLFSVLTGFFLKVTHTYFPAPFIWIALSATIVYTFLALAEIFSVKRINQPEKIMWIVGFLFFNTITGLLYFVLRRKYLTRTSKVLSLV